MYGPQGNAKMLNVSTSREQDVIVSNVHLKILELNAGNVFRTQYDES